MRTNLNLEKGTFSEYLHVPFKHVKKYTFLDWTFEWGPFLTYFQSFQKYLEQYPPSYNRVTKTLLQRTLELNTYKLEGVRANLAVALKVTIRKNQQFLS